MCHGFRHVFQRGLIYGSTGDVIKSQSRVHVVYIIKKVKKFQIIFFWYSQTVFFESDRRWHEREEEKKFLTDFKLKKRNIFISLLLVHFVIFTLFSLFSTFSLFSFAGIQRMPAKVPWNPFPLFYHFHLDFSFETTIFETLTRLIIIIIIIFLPII